MIYRKTLRIVDSNEKLMSMLVTHAHEDLHTQLSILVSILQALLPQFKDGNSENDFLEYLALHFSWYNRYTQSVSL